MMAFSIAYGCASGRAEALLSAALEGAERAVGVTLSLAGGYMFFCGLLEIAAALNVPAMLAKLLAPALRKLLPNVKSKEAHRAAALNLSLNLLGVGNAATPAGMEAVRRMEEECAQCPSVKNDIELFLILNATGLQLIPTTVLAMRAAAGSADVNAVVLPTLACTAFSSAVGILLGLWCRRRKEKTACSS